MQITVKSTKEIVHINGAPARAWVGTTAEGTPIVAYITAIQASVAEDNRQLELELNEQILEPPAQAPALHAQAKEMAGARA